MRAVIKYLNLKGMSTTEIHEDMMQTLGKESPFLHYSEKMGGRF